MKTDIVIVTGMGPGLGQGHFQRMASLLAGLRDRHRLAVSMIIDPRGGEVPGEILPHVIEEIGSPGLVIRDMRDSTAGEVQMLRRHAPVCVIDDRGPGRERADFALDILPHPDEGSAGNAVRGDFLFGYNFLQSLITLEKPVIEKTVDFIAYAGALPDPGGAEWLASLLPRDSDWFLLGKGSPVYYGRDGVGAHADAGYAGMILSSRVAITHFGLFLYEAYASGCGLVTVNPTEYHSVLADIAGREMELTNLGVFPGAGREAAARLLRKALDSVAGKEMGRDETVRRVTESNERCAASVFAMLR
jgi:hypothetical protein